MATLKFVLSKSQHQKKVKSNESLLMLRYTHQKKVCYFSTQKNIDEKYWDSKNQQMKRSYGGSDRFNIYIKKIRQKVEDIVNEMLIAEDNPTTQQVKQKYTEAKTIQQKKTQFTFYEYAERYLEISKNHKTNGTIKTYRTTLNQLKKYEAYTKIKLNWHNIDMDFYYDFQQFYTGVQGLTNNGFGRVIKILKVILNDATEQGYNSNKAFRNRKFKTVKEEVNNIYLNENELKKILDLDLRKNQVLERVRDLFIVGCYTGLRFSDFSQIKKENIFANSIRVKTIKTDEWVIIPLLDIVKNILLKYKNSPNNLPKSCVNQTMNKHLKYIGRLAKIDEPIVKIRNRGKERVTETIPKYKLITTHTARRSFATNMFKRGLQSRMIMKVTGHRTEQAFSSYIKVSQEENAELMLKFLNQSA